MAGRKRKLSKKLTEQILDYLSDGLTIRQVFEKPEIDYTWTSFRKELVADPELMDRYQKAKELAIDLELSNLKDKRLELEAKIEKHAGNLSRAAVELAKDWRTDKYLRRLEALMAVGDKNNSYIISGTGDVLEPEGDVIGIGSGGNYALAAGKVLMEGNLSAEEVAKKAIKVAADICVFTNENVKVEKI